MSHGTKRNRVIGIGWASVALAGLVIHVIAISTPVSFGWFASSSISADVLTSEGVVVLTWQAVLGAVILAAGIMGVAYVIGAERGARRRDVDAGPRA